MPIIGGRQIGVRGLGFQGAGKPTAPTINSVSAPSTSSVTVNYTLGASNGAPITAIAITSSPSISLSYASGDLDGSVTGKPFSSVTDFDADELRENLKAVRERSARLQNELDGLQSLIEDKIVKANPAKVTATIDIRGDINLRNAVRRVFGDKKTTLTFDDYKAALQLRTRFEREEVEAVGDDEFKLK
jgi:hypothetical protein